MMRCILVGLTLLPQAAWAHIDTEAPAFTAPLLAGMVHPTLNPPHLIAAMAVGLFAAVSGGTARWACPASSFGPETLGGLVGYIHPLAHPNVVALVLFLSLAFGALIARNSLVGLCAALALLGVALGYAHGLEGRELGSPLFGIGLLSAIVLLQGLGFLLGFALGTPSPAIIGVIATLTFLSSLIVVFV